MVKTYLKPCKDKLLAYLRKQGPGRVISYEEMSKACDLDVQDNRIVVDYARKVLIKENTILLNIRMQGYRIAEPQDVVGYSQSLRVKSNNLNQRAAQAIETVDMKDLPEELVNSLLMESFKAKTSLQVYLSTESKLIQDCRHDRLAIPATADLLKSILK